MSQTVLEINAKTSQTRNSDNSAFSQVFGEPIKVVAGSSIDFLNGFIDLGAQSVNDEIYIPEKIRLGINYYRYEMDCPQLPKNQGTDAPYYRKRYIYWYPAEIDVPDPKDEMAIIDQPIYNQNTQIHPIKQYGNRTNLYANSNLPAIFSTRVNQTVTPSTNPADPAGTQVRTDFFECVEETAYVDIDPGYYSKVKFCQLVNDGFNLINGSFTNSDKPLETKTPPNPATYYTYDAAPYDYQLPPNQNSNLLRAIEYPYNTAKVTGHDPNSINPHSKIYTNDLTQPYWMIPFYSIPDNQNYYIPEEFPPYCWYNNNENGWLVGTTKFALNYDSSNDIFYLEYLHSPIIDQEQREVVSMSRAKAWYDDLETIGYKSIGALSGIMISRLFSNTFDATGNPTNTNSGFWQSLGFGFDDAYQTQFKADIKTREMDFVNNWQDVSPLTEKFGIRYKFSTTYPDPKYMTMATTTALSTLQMLQQQNFTDPTTDRGLAIFSGDLPKVFQSVGTRVIYADNGEAYQKPDPYYLVSVNISHLKNDNYRDRDTYRQVMSIAGKTYSSGISFIQLFSDSSITALNLTDTIYIDKIEIEILSSSDKSLVQNLGDSSCIFLKITQPIEVPA